MSALEKIKNKELYISDPVELSAKVEKSLSHIKDMSKSYKVWNRSHSDVAWNLHVLDHESETRNLSQVSAEIKQKRDALVHANFSYKKACNRAKFHFDKASAIESENDSEYEILLGQEEEAKALNMHEAVIGCTKDISALKSSYDKILARIIEKHGKFDEEIFEIEEREYWIRRAFKQSACDVRERGSITKGEQMLLEQLGIDPTEAQSVIMEHISIAEREVSQGKTMNPKYKEQFMDYVVERFMPHLVAKISKMGEDKSHLYIEEGE